MKLKVDNSFKKELETFENEHSIVAEYTPRSENYFDISCKIVEHNETIFEVNTFVGSKEQAKEIVDNWKSHADSIYPAILKVLTDTNNKKTSK